MNRIKPALNPLELDPNLTVREALERVLRLPSVASKRYLTNKVIITSWSLATFGYYVEIRAVNCIRYIMYFIMQSECPPRGQNISTSLQSRTAREYHAIQEHIMYMFVPLCCNILLLYVQIRYITYKFVINLCLCQGSIFGSISRTS